MCGIAGIIKESGREVNINILKSMAAKIEHRGPDEEGFIIKDSVGLAIKRLNIIDLSSGAQPQTSIDGRYQIVFNGEIYNYKDLRDSLSKKGYVFKNKSDTETILAAFFFYGAKAIEMLDGMFSFAIYDSKRKITTLVRDRLGVKPLYYNFLKDGTVIFASEIKALTAYPDFKPKFNPQALDNLLTFGFQLSPGTFFKGVSQVLPGHYLKITEKSIKQYKYWDLDVSKPKLKSSRKDISLMLKEHLENAVEKRLVSDVPVASYLSGGIDSSIVSGIYSKLRGGDIHTFSIGFEDDRYNELNFAQSVSNFFSTKNTSFNCKPKSSDFTKLIYHLENPLVTLLNLPLFYLSQKVKDSGFKVVLSGDGSDEFLGGYQYFRQMKVFDFIKRGKESPYRMKLLSRLNNQADTELKQRELFNFFKLQQSKINIKELNFPYLFNTLPNKQQFLSNEINEIMQNESNIDLIFNVEEINNLPLMDQVFYMETKLRLLNLTLPLSDKMSMANSIENRSPFLDYKLVEFITQIPNHLKIRGLNEKHILKNTFKDFLPLEIIKRRKQPLAASASWFLNLMKEPVQYYTSDAIIKEKGYFNPLYLKFIKSEKERNSKIDYSALLLMVCFMHLWDDLFIQNKSI